MRTHPFNAVERGILAALLVAIPVLGSTKIATAAADAARSSDNGSASISVAGAPKAAAWGPAQIVVFKSKRTLALYRGGDFAKEFRIVLGLQPEGRKRHAHDARTPEGLYRVSARNRHARWQWFLSIDYPNAADRRAYESAVRAGRIPDEDGSPFAIGGSLGIHGNDRAAEQEAGTDWTKGCIAMAAGDIAELASQAPVGTPVWIVE
jgi:murein L,D-transpeptidase YafK